MWLELSQRIILFADSSELEEAKNAVKSGDWKSAFLGYLPILLKTILIFVIGIFVVHYLMRAIAKMIKTSSIDTRFHTVIMQGIKIGLFSIVITMGLSTLIGSTALSNMMVTIFGTIGLALSLAVKDDLSNYISGFLILGNKQFAIGDHIKVGDQSGKVVDIKLNYTLLNSDDNQQIFIPNSIMAKSVIINSTGENTRQISLTYTIKNVSDLSQAKDIIQKIVNSNKKILADPSPFVGVASVASVVKIETRVWVRTPDLYSVKFSLNESIPEAFEKAGISTY